MSKIIIQIITIALILNMMPLSFAVEETIQNHEDSLFNELEQLLSFDYKIAENIKVKLREIEGYKETSLTDIEDYLEELPSLEIKDIKEALDCMIAGGPPVCSVGNGDTEYWAVLIGVDFTWYYNNLFRAPFDIYAEQLFNVLDLSDHWQKDHIKVLTNENATLVNIIAALLWLDLMDDGDDISLIYYGAHGCQLDWDLIPKDEEDKKDEFVTTYWTGKNHFAIITDDLLNFLLNRLDSEGTTVIIEACYGGGMIDLNHKNKRVMMSECNEDEESTIGFATELTTGLQGYADDINEGGNNDGSVSAEEAFLYAKQNWNGPTEPVIYDGYMGELILADVYLPPDVPILEGPNIVNDGEEPVYYAYSSDPENDTIKYGWDWHHNYSFSQEGYVDEWTELYNSGETCTLSHQWNKPGIYDVRVKARDSHGAERLTYNKVWSKAMPTIVCAEEEIVDQWQTYNDMFMDITHPYAQSFIPDSNTLAKIKLKFRYKEYIDPYNLTLTIREELDGENLTKMDKTIKTDNSINERIKWIEFIPERLLELTINKQYYMVLERNYDGPHIFWAYTDEENHYSKGQAYYYDLNYHQWRKETVIEDFCFVIYNQTSSDSAKNLISYNNPQQSTQGLSSLSTTGLNTLLGKTTTKYNAIN